MVLSNFSLYFSPDLQYMFSVFIFSYFSSEYLAPICLKLILCVYFTFYTADVLVYPPLTWCQIWDLHWQCPVVCVMFFDCWWWLQVSMPMITLVGGLWMSGIAALFTAICEKINWLQFLYFLSYIKVATTPIKYCPQVSPHIQCHWCVTRL